MKDEIRTRLWIGNEWADAEGGGRFATVNPATDEVIAELEAKENE